MESHGNHNQVPQHILQQQQQLINRNMQQDLQNQQRLQQHQMQQQQQQQQLQQQQQQQQQQMQMQVQNQSINQNQNTHSTSQQQRQVFLMAGNNMFTIGPYRKRKDASRISVLDKYDIIGYIAAGTYGKVYKAKGKKDSSNIQEKKSTVNVLDISNKNINEDEFARIRNTNTKRITTGTQKLKNEDETTITDILNKKNKINGSEPSLNDSNIKGSKSRENMSLNPDNGGQTSSLEDIRSTTNGVRKTNNLKGESVVSSAVGNESHQLENKPTLKPTQFYAIKKFKTEREGVEQLHYTGISQSACREMALCRELDHKHLTKLVEIFLEKKSIYMVSEFAEHDLLQIIHSHSHPEKKLIPPKMLKSIMWQIIDGVSYLHQNWILHRDLKPANIMVSVDGCIKIGDLGLARKYNNLLQNLYTGDKVVVTIWYRAPELLLGARHYTPAVDMWAVGCIFAELIGLRPLFKGEEAKIDSKKSVPFQASQFKKIIEILGTPTPQTWSDITKYPEYPQINNRFPHYENNLIHWYQACNGKDQWVYGLLSKLLTYNPIERIDATTALDHTYFHNNKPSVSENIFEGLKYKYPPRRIHTSDNDIMGIGKNLQLQQQQQQQLLEQQQKQEQQQQHQQLVEQQQVEEQQKQKQQQILEQQQKLIKQQQQQQKIVEQQRMLHQAQQKEQQQQFMVQKSQPPAAALGENDFYQRAQNSSRENSNTFKEQSHQNGDIQSSNNNNTATYSQMNQNSLAQNSQTMKAQKYQLLKQQLKEQMQQKTTQKDHINVYQIPGNSLNAQKMDEQQLLALKNKKNDMRSRAAAAALLKQQQYLMTNQKNLSFEQLQQLRQLQAAQKGTNENGVNDRILAAAAAAAAAVSNPVEPPAKKKKK